MMQKGILLCSFLRGQPGYAIPNVRHLRSEVGSVHYNTQRQNKCVSYVPIEEKKTHAFDVHCYENSYCLEVGSVENVNEFCKLFCHETINVIVNIIAEVIGDVTVGGT